MPQVMPLVDNYYYSYSIMKKIKIILSPTLYLLIPARTFKVNFNGSYHFIPEIMHLWLLFLLSNMLYFMCILGNVFGFRDP